MAHKSLLTLYLLAFVFVLNISCGSSGSSTSTIDPDDLIDASDVASEEVQLSSKEYLHVETGVIISWEATPEIFPKHWLEDPFNGIATPIAEDQVQDAIDIIVNGLNKYPKTILQDNLVKVYVTETLSFYDLNYGGTLESVTKRIYITKKGNSKTDERLFHHEFSSILSKYYPNLLDEITWDSTNPEDFNYGTGGVDAIKNGNVGQRFWEIHLVNGFLGLYSTSSMVNDFNLYAEYLFSGNEEFWFYVDNYEKVGIKARLTIDFYNSIDPMFTEEYFRSIPEIE
ncbi:MAG: hypothetical protein COA79_21360 [Planctomycetota bacterium]|nr:MAG: hypothetical protein COA79_21360 [Planctomycetota bacterium]